jgi:hypothetical protein
MKGIEKFSFIDHPCPVDIPSSYEEGVGGGGYVETAALALRHGI